MKIPKRNKAGYYSVLGRDLVSVTTVLSIIDVGLGDWKGRVGGKEAGRISREATTLGKQVHKLPEADIKGIEPKLPKKISFSLGNCIKAYERWKDERREKLLLAEEFVYSLIHGYAGTCDAIGEDAVYDFKTSKRISPLYWLQLAAYAWAIMEMARAEGRTVNIRRLVIVRLDKDSGDYYQVEREYSEDLVLSFLASLRMWRFYNTTEKENDDGTGTNDDRIIASLDIEPNRSGNGEEGSDEEVDRSEDSDDRAGEVWQV